MEDVKAMTGMYIKPNGWSIGNHLMKDKYTPGYKDESFPGCQFRLESVGGPLAINVRVTGRKIQYTKGLDSHVPRVRAEVEWVHDGEPSTFSGAWLYLNRNACFAE